MENLCDRATLSNTSLYISMRVKNTVVQNFTTWGQYIII